MYGKIDKAWAEYKEIDEKVIKLGATTDSNQSLKAQSMMRMRRHLSMRHLIMHLMNLWTLMLLKVMQKN